MSRLPASASMRRMLLLAAGLAAAAASPGHAQRHLGELRLLGTVGRLDAATPRPGYSMPDSPADVAAGGLASLAFVHGALSGGPEAFKLFGSDRRVGSLGVSARLTPGAGRLRPHAVLGVGWYNYDIRRIEPGTAPSWGSEVKPRFAGSAGAGVTLGEPGATLALTAEGRLHRSLDRRENEGPRHLYSLMTGVRIAW